MYITNVISYRNAWEKLNNDFQDILSDLENTLEIDFELIIHEYHSRNKKYSPMFDYYDLLHKHVLNGLRSYDWQQGVKVDDIRSLNKLGLFKNKISLHYVPEPSNSLMNWIFRDVVAGFNSDQLSMPIMLYFNEDTEDLDQKYFGHDLPFGDANELIKIYDQLESIEPLNFDFPFLILGFSIDQRKIKMKEIKLLNSRYSDGDFIKLNSTITFQPEYFQAGLGILSYFSTVLREKYPEQKAKVKIEQQDFTVRRLCCTNLA